MAEKTDQILRIDLSSGNSSSSPLDASLNRFIGGRGVGIALLEKEITPETAALSPENPLIFGTGPLTGTPAPASGRLSLVTKNAVNDGVCFSNGGGHFAPELRYSGISHLIVTGRSQSPVFIYIDDGKLDIRDASELWGLDTWETDTWIKDTLGDNRVQILSIGPAGERKSLMSCIMINNSRAMGFGGSGAIMGSKNLKALVVKGRRKAVKPVKQKDFMKNTDNAFQKINSSIGTGYLREGGTIAKIGGGLPLPTRNYQDGNWMTGKHISTKSFQAISDVRRLACFNCPMYCSHLFSVKTGEYAGLKTEGTQINIVRGLGSLWDMPNPGFILKAGSLANRYGLHVDELAATLSWAAECYERGILSEEEVGVPLVWGNEKAFLTLIERIAFRQGFGDILADGVYRAAERTGKGSKTYAMTIKKTGINEGNVRGKKGWALGIATSSRGGGHLSGSPNSEGVPSYTPSVGKARYGVPQAGNAGTYEGKPALIFWFERFKAVVDSLGLCYFTSYWQNNLLGPKDYAELLSSLTGQDYSEEKLFEIGEEILNMEHSFNVKHAGFTRKDDHFPDRFYREEVQSGKFKGAKLDEDKWEEMLDEYYELHNWSKE